MYSETDREIYQFTLDGKTYRRDPMLVMARFMEAAAQAGQNPESLFKAIDGEDGPPNDRETLLRLVALRKLAPLAAHAIGLPLFSEETGEGLPMAIVIEEFNAYLAWRNDVKKNSGATPSGSTPSAGPPVASGPEGAD